MKRKELLWLTCLAAKSWYESLVDADPENAEENLAILKELKKYMQERWGTSSSKLEELTRNAPTFTIQELRIIYEKQDLVV